MNHKRILIVDDDIDTTKLLSLRLDNEKFDVVVSHDGESALEIISSTNPDLIILDIKLPKIDGYRVLGWARSHPKYKEIPIIFSTADASLDVKDKAKELGANDCVIKPYDSNDLIQKIHRLLDTETTNS